MKQVQKNKILKLVKDNYRDIAAEFDSSRKKYLWPELNKIVAEVQGGARLLDIGCGNGRLIESFIGKNIEYIGIDNSEELINRAKNNYPDYKFLIGDILNLKDLKLEGDFVFSVAVLHHLPGFDLRLEGLKQLLGTVKDGGTLVFSVWKMWDNKKYRPLLLKAYWQKIIGNNKLDFGDLLFQWKDNKGKPVSERYYHAYTKRELKSLLKAAAISKYDLYSDAHNYWIIVRNK